MLKVFFQVNPPIKDNGNLLVEFEVIINDLEEESWTPPSPPIGPDTPSSGSIDFKGIFIENSSSSINLPEWEAPLPPEKTVDYEVFSSVNGQSEKFLPALRDTNQPQKITVKLSDLGGQTEAIKFKNNNTFKEITVL